MYKKQNKIGSYILPLIAFITSLTCWEAIDYIFNIREIILPNPHEIIYEIASNFGLLISNTYTTMLESVLGFIIGSVFGILLALLFVYSSSSKKALYPYAIALKTTPLYVFAPLLVIWFGNGIASKVVMSALVAFFPVLVNAVKGLTSIDQEGIDLFNSLSASKLNIFLKLRIPNSLPYLFPALKMATTLSVVGATIAEFTGASSGIGHLIVNSSYYLETSLMFAGIIFISLAGVVFFYLFEFLEKRIVFWQINE